MTFVACNFNREVGIAPEILDMLPNLHLSDESMQERHGDEFAFGLGFFMYQNSRARISQLDSYKMTVFRSTELFWDEGDGLGFDIYEWSGFYEIVLHCLDSGHIYLYMEMDTFTSSRVTGEWSESMATYYRNGVLYISDSYFGNSRVTLSYEEVLEELDSHLPDIPRESIIAERASLLEDGNMEVTLFIGVNHVPLVRDELYYMVDALWYGWRDIYKIEFPIMILTATIDENGFFHVITLTRGVHVIIEGAETEKVELYTRLEFSNFNDVEIYFPAYIDDFEYQVQ